jgi:DNA-binding NarL/FixJ family response regulator
VLMLNSFGLDSYTYDSLRAGANGFMLKDARLRRSRSSDRAKGESLLAPSVTWSVIEEVIRHPSHSSTEGQS